MKRKLLLSILSLICALTCAFGFAACGDNTPHSHSWSQSWERSETHHWHNCTAENCTVTDNSQKDGYTEHDFSDGNCVCGQPKPHTHIWSQSWERSETHHWHNCTAENCTVTDNSQKDGYAEHDFSDGDCICGQPKPHTHIWSQSWEINDTHHWHNCTAENCTVTDNSQKGGYAEHDFSNGNCVCGQPKLTAGLTYVLNPDGKSYSVKGGGTAKDTEIYIPALYKGKPVTHISDNAFDARIRFTSVTIPDSVTSIGNRAFRDCVGLTSVTIGKGVTTIGENAFTRCNKLTSIKIPDSVTSIGNYAFDGCTGLTSITIPDSVTSIGRYAFRDCTSLMSVTIGNGVTSIGDDAFNGCSSLQYNEYDNAYYLGNASNPYVILIKAKDTSITNCTINSNTKIISSFAFYDCSGLTSITIPDSVTSIGRYAFRDCTSLMSVTIGNGVTSIGDYAFNGCSALTSVIIGNGVTSIGDTAFNGCSKLKYNEYDNAYYLGNASNPYVVLMKAKNMSIKNCTINSNTKYIYFNAFQQCGSLTSITIPDSVTTIGSWAFYGCRALTSITIPDSVTIIGDNAFSGCNALTSITIPDSVTAIGDEAFSGCSALTSITIPDSVTSIGDYAFSGCSALTSVTIGSNVERIGEWAFQSCSALTSVTFTNTSGWWVSTSRTATSGTNVDVTDISQNASYFTSTYQSYYWKRG